MAERFVSLATLLRGGAPSAPSSPQASDAASAAPSTGGAPDADEDAAGDLLGELGLMRLAAREAYERLAATLLETLARDVLARELALEPAAIEALVQGVLASAAPYEPVAVAVARADRERVRSDVPVRVDDALAAGDLVVEVRDGAFVSTFAMRLETALARVADALRS